jgi:hypothetical protein
MPLIPPGMFDNPQSALLMPNSLVTFNRFWQSAGTAVDQAAITTAFLRELPDYGQSTRESTSLSAL